MLLHVLELHFFLWLNNISLHIWCVDLFIHSSVDGHLDCFYVLTIASSAAVNIGINIWDPALNPLGIYLVVELLDHMVVCVSLCEGQSSCFQCCFTILYSTSHAQAFQFLCTLTNTILGEVTWYLIVALCKLTFNSKQLLKILTTVSRKCLCCFPWCLLLLPRLPPDH